MSQLIFPLQTTQPDYAVASNLIAAQQDILSYVIQTLAGYVDNVLGNQQQAIESVTRVLQASARGRVAANGRRINPVVECLGTCAAVAVAEDSIQANRAAASVGCPCPAGAGAAVPAIPQPGGIAGLPRSLPGATPAIVVGGQEQPGGGTTPAGLPPGCIPLALRDRQDQVQYPSGYPAQDFAVNRSAALGYTPNLDGSRSYFSVPSATGPTLVPPSILVGYYDIPAGYLPFSSNPASPPTMLCPGVGTVPPPGTTPPGTTPPPDTTPPGTTPPPDEAIQWFCVRSRSQTGEILYQTRIFENILEITTSPFEYVSGPFPTEALAKASCDAISGQVSIGVTCPTVVFPHLPEWCSSNVCDTIDAVTSAAHGTGLLDLFKLLGAGTLEAPGGAGTWLDAVKTLPAVGEWLHAVITIGLCAAGGVVNAALTSTGPNVPGFLVANGAVFLAGLGQRLFGSGFDDIRTRAGYWANYQSPTFMPSVGEADAAFVRGFIDRKQWRCWVRANNVCDEPHEKILEAQYLRPSWSQAEKLHRVGLIDEESLDRYYAHSGIGNPGEAAMFRELYTQYPGMDSIISFMVRDVFDTNAIVAGELDKEFTDKYKGEALRYGNIAGLSPDLAKLYWMAHWRQPATSELYTMLHRLRPGAVEPKLEVTSQQVAQQLGINDVAPAWREKLMAISYHSVSIRQARQFFQNDVINKQGVIDIYLDQGYRPDLAQKAGDNEVIVKRRALAQLFKGWTPAAIASAYAAGKMTDVEVSAHAGFLGASKLQIDALKARAKIDRASKVQLRAESRAITRSWSVILKAYQSGSVDRQSALKFLLQHGWSETSAQLALDSEDVQARQRVIDQGVRTIRGAYLTGVLTAAAVPIQLAAIGVSPPRSQEYLTAWTLQLTPRRKVLSGQQALRLYSEGMLDEPTVRGRLTNLGWTDPDLSLLILEARNKRLAAEARAAKAAERERIQAAALLAKEVKRQQDLVKSTQSKLCHMVPVSRLIKWYAHRYIDRAYLLARLQACGYTPDVITGYIEEADDARATEEARAAKTQAGVRSGSGSSTGNGADTSGTAPPNP